MLEAFPATINPTTIINMQFPITPEERQQRALSAGYKAFWKAVHLEYHEVPAGVYINDAGVRIRLEDAQQSAVRNWLLDNKQEYWAGIDGAEPPFGKPPAPSKKPSIQPIDVPDVATTPDSPLAQLGTPGHSHVSWYERQLAAKRDGKWVWWLLGSLAAASAVGFLWAWSV